MVDDEKTQQEMTEKVLEATDPIVANDARIVTILNGTRRRVESIGGWLKLLVALPCYILFAVLLALIVLPFVLVSVFLIAEPAADAVAWVSRTR